MFRPNAVDKEREKGFTKSEVMQHMQFMTLVEKDAEDIKNKNSNQNQNLNQNSNQNQNQNQNSNQNQNQNQENGSSYTENYDFTASEWYINGGGIIVNPQNNMVSKF